MAAAGTWEVVLGAGGRTWCARACCWKKLGPTIFLLFLCCQSSSFLRTNGKECQQRDTAIPKRTQCIEVASVEPPTSVGCAAACVFACECACEPFCRGNCSAGANAPRSSCNARGEPQQQQQLLLLLLLQQQAKQNSATSVYLLFLVHSYAAATRHSLTGSLTHSLAVQKWIRRLTRMHASE